MEGDSYRLYISGVWKKFQPTPSVGRATCASSHGTNLNLHFNPLPPWGGRQASPQKRSRLMCHFNPRPPWGGRPAAGRQHHNNDRFQSTPSVGRATRHNTIAQHKPCISIHALRGEGDHTPGRVHSHSTAFQSTPSVGRATSSIPAILSIAITFQSTPSVGRATLYKNGATNTRRISIHALRGEGDRTACANANPNVYFNPRPPWGGRRAVR